MWIIKRPLDHLMSQPNMSSIVWLFENLNQNSKVVLPLLLLCVFTIENVFSVIIFVVISVHHKVVKGACTDEDAIHIILVMTLATAMK